MVMKPIKNLSKIQKEMLWIVSRDGKAHNPPKLDQIFSKNLCNLFWEKFDQAKILMEFKQLVELGYFDTIGDLSAENYVFSENGYFETKKFFRRKHLVNSFKKRGYQFWVFIWKHFIFTVITAAITAAITVYLTSKYK